MSVGCRASWGSCSSPSSWAGASSVRPGASDPDFSDDVYTEFLLDEVLRGDFEAQAVGFQKAINSGWMTPAEVRRARNLPFIEGSDRLLVNSTIVPLDQLGEQAAPSAAARAAVRPAMGLLSRVESLVDVDAAALAASVPDDLAAAVVAEWVVAVAAGESVPEFRARLKALVEGAA